MITVGTETKLAVQWAADLADPEVGKGSLLVPYKNALLYIDKRGWFGNKYASRSDLENEIQRVLDVRIAFEEGEEEEDEWPEFPFPTRWQTWKASIAKASIALPTPKASIALPTPKPSIALPTPPTSVKPSFAAIAERSKSLPMTKVAKQKQTVEGLIKLIVRDEPLHRKAAIEYLRDHAPKWSRSDQQTVTIMWKLDGSSQKKASGGSAVGVSTLRATYGVPQSKETLCAEEIFLLKNGTKGWVVSASYDMRFGWKCACTTGCATILGKLLIRDIAEHLSQKASQAGVKSWGTY